mmetsp:Transcript_62566/g.110400  ORF Transcript_62566/g.110400 Transcript_62566/m.110400 type:complete len:230 (+) Transcript_62566:999-1688(+)
MMGIRDTMSAAWNTTSAVKSYLRVAIWMPHTWAMRRTTTMGDRRVCKKVVAAASAALISSEASAAPASRGRDTQKRVARVSCTARRISSREDAPSGLTKIGSLSSTLAAGTTAAATGSALPPFLFFLLLLPVVATAAVVSAGVAVLAAGVTSTLTMWFNRLATVCAGALNTPSFLKRLFSTCFTARAITSTVSISLQKNGMAWTFCLPSLNSFSSSTSSAAARVANWPR